MGSGHSCPVSARYIQGETGPCETGNSMKDYEPIACAVHDQLEHHAIRHTLCRIRYLDDDAAVIVNDRIADIVTEQGAEYLILEKSGLRIRLDLIQSIQATR